MFFKLRNYLNHNLFYSVVERMHTKNLKKLKRTKG